MQSQPSTDRVVSATVRDPRWLAVVTRDRSADGRFYYSVASSGVYCRPSCAARLANPRNVRFHASPEAAEAAGFRACKRCKPERPLSHVPRRTPNDVRFGIGDCALGRLLVAATDKGICAVLIGDDAVVLAHDVRRRFTTVEPVGNDPGFDRLIALVARKIAEPNAPLELPLDPRGSAFQIRVWRALTAIPPGTTASYADIARRLAAPRAVRAVAQACAANPLAVIVPCHRVVKSDGALSGYRWGVERKRALLAREARMA